MDEYGVLFFRHYVTAYGWGLVHLIDFFSTSISSRPFYFVFQPHIAVCAIFFLLSRYPSIGLD